MLVEIIIAFTSAIAIQAQDIIKVYAKHNGTYDNLVKASDLTNKFLQMAASQQLPTQQNTTTDENR